MILMSSKHVTVNQMKLLVLQLYKVECCRDPVFPGQFSLLYLLLGKLSLYLSGGGLTVYLEMFSWCIKMTKFMGHWKQFRSNSGNGCSTSQGVLYLATGGTEGYTRGVQGPKYCGVHH